MITCILSTDMSQHFSELNKLKTRISSSDYEPKGRDKINTLNMLFHLSDIANGTKTWQTCRSWTDLLFEEFFAQGDREREKKQPISYLMDRKTVNIAKSQIGFLDVIIAPAFLTVSHVVHLSRHLSNIEVNKDKWNQLFDEYEQKMLIEQ